MDADLIVVGAGIVGSEAARAGRAAGVEVLHLAAGQPPHSLAAAAVARSTYLPVEQRAGLPETLENYGGAVTCAGGFVTSYRKPDERPRAQKDWWLIDPRAPLARPDVTVGVEEVRPGVVETGQGRYTCRAVVLATGAHSALSPRGKVTWGVTWTGPLDALAYPDALRIHQWAPYKAISCGPAGGLARLGSSSGANPETAMRTGDQLLQRAHEAGMVTRPGSFLSLLGARLKTEQTVQRQGRAVYWVGGHHRNGYARGPVDAARAVRAALGEAAG